MGEKVEKAVDRLCHRNHVSLGVGHGEMGSILVLVLPGTDLLVVGCHTRLDLGRQLLRALLGENAPIGCNTYGLSV